MSCAPCPKFNKLNPFFAPPTVSPPPSQDTHNHNKSNTPPAACSYNDGYGIQSGSLCAPAPVSALANGKPKLPFPYRSNQLKYRRNIVNFHTNSNRGKTTFRDNIVHSRRHRLHLLQGIHRPNNTLPRHVCLSQYCNMSVWDIPIPEIQNKR
jgi:hypothetical protein